MPSGQLAPVVQDVPLDIQPSQAKFCSLCHSALSDAAFHLLADALVCPPCRDGIRSTRQPRQPSLVSPTGDQRSYRLPLDGSASNNNVYYHPRTHPSPHEAPSLQTTRRNQENPHSQSSQPLDVQCTQQQQQQPFSADTAVSNGSVARQAFSGGHLATPHVTSAERPFQYLQLPPLSIGPSSFSTITGGSSSNRAPASSTGSSGGYYASAPSPLVQQQQNRRTPHTLARSAYTSDPLVDITRLRVRSQVHQCLYPGARFEGTQKSGRNSYDVTVTVVDVDFTMSTLCGYLRIRGLTEDWPELTTYFDAEIIGPRYGFRTLNWGASENEDQVHWARFPAYKHARSEAKGPHMTIDDRDRGAVFMRWKERFLVPDHRVHDINGASFAGFYYVCVDFNSLHGGSAAVEDDETSEASILPSDKDSRRRRGSSVAPNRPNRSKSRPRVTPLSPPVATMSGFYYHQNSEPYQQLSLTHVTRSTSSSFEFR